MNEIELKELSDQLASAAKSAKNYQRQIQAWASVAELLKDSYSLAPDPVSITKLNLDNSHSFIRDYRDLLTELENINKGFADALLDMDQGYGSAISTMSEVSEAIKRQGVLR